MLRDSILGDAEQNSQDETDAEPKSEPDGEGTGHDRTQFTQRSPAGILEDVERFVDFLSIDGHVALTGNVLVFEHAENFIVVFQRTISAGRPLDRAVLSVDRLVMMKAVEKPFSGLCAEVARVPLGSQ